MIRVLQFHMGVYALNTTVEHYLDLVPRDKLILGLPLYGRDWESVDDSIPGVAIANGVAVFLDDVNSLEQSYTPLFDVASSTSYILISQPSNLVSNRR